MKLLFARWLSAMLALCLLLSLSPAALMEGETEAQAAVVEETAPTAEGEEQAEPSEEAAEPAADDAVEPAVDAAVPEEAVEEADVVVASEPVDAVVEEIEDADLLDLPVLEAQSDGDKLDLDALEEISVVTDDASATLMEPASIQNNSVFPDANFREYLKKFDTDGDGSLSDAERAAVTEINVWYRGISDLTGIKLFPNLSVLDCSSNQLTSLDVSGLTSLSELYCNSNQLITLNVSGCTNLEYLRCYFNRLTTLDVSGLTSLSKLPCDNNQLITLDVSGCTSLDWLECSHNQLTSLDVSGLKFLSKLYCYSNQLTSLDVSGCTSLWVLDCYSNKLTNLDVSGCTNLYTLNCHSNKLTNLDVSGCTSLYTLNCHSNKLTNLDVSGCTSLDGLYCHSNQLTNIDVSGCTNLRVLECYYNQLTKLDLSDNPKIARIANREYIVTDNELDDPTVVEFYSESLHSSLLIDSSVQIITGKPADKPSDTVDTVSSSAPAPAAPAEPITITKTPASTKAKAKKGKVTVSWKKIKKNKKTKAVLKQIKGVEVQYSTDPTFATNVQTRKLGKKKSKVTLKGLQKKTVYYIRVRYVGAGGVSNWSAVKRVKTKK